MNDQYERSIADFLPVASELSLVQSDPKLARECSTQLNDKSHV